LILGCNRAFERLTLRCRPRPGKRATALAAATLALLAGAASARAADAAAALEDEGSLVEAALALADERLALMPAVAAAKWPRHLPVSDPAREAAVSADAASRAATLGLEPGAVAEYFGVQMALAREVQQRLNEGWNRAGGPTGTAPDLAGELRPRLDRLTAATLRALYLAAPFTTSDGFGARAAERATAALPAARWTDADRARLVDALARVRVAAPSSPSGARAAGVLRVGTPADYAPFSVAHGRSLEGVDVDLATALARSLGLEPVFVRSSWRSLLEDLAASHFDLAAGGISVTPARAALAEFSAPTSRSGKTAIGRCADQQRFATLAGIDRPDVTVVFNPGGTNESFVRSHLHAAQLRLHADNRTVFDELDARSADVMFTDEIEVALATRRHPGLCRLLSDAFEPADKAFLLPRGSGWPAVVAPWLSAERERGTPARLLESYLAR